MLNNKSNHTANIKTYHFHSDLFAALTSGDIDVILTDRSSAEAWYNNTTHIYRLLGEPIQIGFGYGILAHKGRATLLTQINKALLAMEADNTYLKIYNTYFNPREL